MTYCNVGYYLYVTLFKYHYNISQMFCSLSVFLILQWGSFVTVAQDSNIELNTN